MIPSGDGGADWLTCPRTRLRLADLDGVLRASIDAQDLQLRVMALELIGRGGKRLRPTMLLLAGTLGDADRDELLRAAAAVELMHVASLYHDDIMDRAVLRRGEPSVNARWGNTMAAAAGTYLFARAITLVAGLGPVPDRLTADASVRLCTGQMLEMENAYDLDLTPERHLDVLARKTATLFELPCALGAHLGGVPSEWGAALAAYGHHLGIAFQLADDALDLTSTAEGLGKAAGNDLREGVYSLAVLLALRDEDSRTLLRDLLARTSLGSAEVEEAVRCIRASGAVDEALAVARGHVEEASAVLEALPDVPARDSLRALATHAVARTG